MEHAVTHTVLRVEPLHDRIALVHETADEARVMELAIAEAEVLVDALVWAIRMARVAEGVD